MLLKLYGSGVNYVILYNKNFFCIWKISSELNVESERESLLFKVRLFY